MVHFNIDKGSALPEPFTSMLMDELKPAIVGIGEVRTKITPEGIVLLRTQNRHGEDRSHDIHSPGRCCSGMIAGRYPVVLGSRYG